MDYTKQFLYAALTIFLFSPTANAANYQVNNTYLTVLAQSRVESGVNAVSSSVNIYGGSTHPTCGNVMYINFDDKEVFATALSAAIKYKTVNVIYSDSASYQTIAGHGMYIPCKIVSLWVVP